MEQLSNIIYILTGKVLTPAANYKDSSEQDERNKIS